MKIIRDGKDIHLTHAELISAHAEYERILSAASIVGFINNKTAEMPDDSDLKVFYHQITSSADALHEIDNAASYKERHGFDWDNAVQEALNEYITENFTIEKDAICAILHEFLSKDDCTPAEKEKLTELLTDEDALSDISCDALYEIVNNELSIHTAVSDEINTILANLQ